MDRFVLMQCFVRAVETGSFSAVARELELGQPTVSKNIAALERHIGVRLLHRSTRRLAMTPEGESFYAECRRILDSWTEAESNARGQNAPAGLLRVACPSALARYRLTPVVLRYLEAHPGTRIDLAFTSGSIDLVEHNLDVGIVLGTPPDSSYRARRVGVFAKVCAASPAYLARHGRPRTPGDLTEHNCVAFSNSVSGALWQFGDEDVRPQGTLTVDNPEGLRAAALAGFGIVVAPTWLFADELHDGRLECLLKQWPIEAVAVHMTYPARRLLATRAKVFMDYVARAFADDPCLNGTAAEELGHGPCVEALRAALA